MARRKAQCFCLILAGLLSYPASAGKPREPSGLFPVSQPRVTGYLQVSDPHSIYYEVHGNPDGKPVFVLHGGPGWGCYPRLTRYFNPEKFLIVLHDQRGAGRSRPAGELRENTTENLVADIERLRTHLEIEGQMLVFGGSWGSTLALAYAETHPRHVSGMVLRGVFTGTQAEIDNVFGHGCARQFFPDTTARVEAALPPDVGDFSPSSFLKVFRGDDAAKRATVAKAWIRYAVKTGKLHASAAEVEQGFGDLDITPGARIDCQYASNRCFLEEGQLLRDADRLRDIPIIIINGRYDMVCPPINAWRLHRRLPKSRLIIVEQAGHSESEPGTTRALIKAVAEFE